MSQQTVLGNEALGLGALHAGLSGVFGYPGTPSTEIFEFIQTQSEKFDVKAIWSANEKVGYEEALGMSFAGKRTLITMKHVGLNVAADPFMNSSMTGVGGGLILAVADDPGMHSSQNEQDSRYFADFARIPCFEPSNQQEAYDIMKYAYELSETQDVPVMVRMLTRLSHSRSNIRISDDHRAQNPLDAALDVKKWVLLPPNARIRNIKLIEKQSVLLEMSETSPFNKLSLNDGAKLGIIATGIAANYVKENLPEYADPVNFLEIVQYPMPEKLIRQIIDASDEILVVEDGYPFVESKIQGMFGIPGKTINGRLSGHLPRTGEMNADHVRNALGITTHPGLDVETQPIPGRPPMLCVGCPHCDSFNALAEAANEYPEHRMFSDIGCYTLGVLPPYNCGHACVDMGASVSMTTGAALAGVTPAIGIIGDSTFIHSGMTPLIGAAKLNLNMNIMIMDNALVAMTGAQETMSTGEDLVDLVVELGVPREHVITFNPLKKFHQENTDLIRKELAYEGLSVLIPQRACIHGLKKG